MPNVLRTVIVLSFGTLVLVAIACGGESGSGTSESYDGPTLRESVKDASANVSLKNREVLNVTLGQDDNEISVVLLVACGTSETAARFFGNELVHMIKTISPDANPPPSELGTGVWDYQINVHCDDSTTIAKGIKASDSAQIVW